jgi:hypothetical protein
VPDEDESPPEHALDAATDAIEKTKTVIARRLTGP